MATFTPPTYEAYPRSYPGHPSYRLWKHYDGIYTGYAVLITSGAASTFPGLATPSQDAIDAADAGSGEAGIAYFAGGHVAYTITSGERTILEAAGYTVVA